MEIFVIDNSPEASARDRMYTFSHSAHYIHEPTAGVANARNSGVLASRGDYVIFIDDDQTPSDTWLAALEAAAESGADACFGSITPRFEAVPPAHLRAVATAMFSRFFPVEDGGDITRFRAYLGTGNSMFRRGVCFEQTAPFDTRFNGGGEDVWLLRHLVDDLGIRLTWSGTAHVEEIVPPDRVTPAFLRRRKFRNGQLRCTIEAGVGGWTAVGRISFWMLVGLVQVAVYGSSALIVGLFDKVRASFCAMKLWGGLGKLLWWRHVG